jgi:lipopolysaccharide transport system ATP-binding protein
MNPVISIENVSKSYRLGLIGSGTLREDLQSWWHRMRGLPDPNARLGQTHDAVEGHTLWALQDVSLEIRAGEVWGIIGRNGAGKSTLLKILSRVTAPTSGRIRVKGRIASLLEVGTGFHPELTGRENIFLNGAILGMTKAEVAKRFDEIVAFSEIEQFIDTPVKRYSSGMYVRLAFAVAAHLEPEILIVDEVLAVGDVAFQSKCLGKMNDVAAHGRTVLFVSHNMTAITELCQKALLLTAGRIDMIGPVQDVVNKYAMHTARSSRVDLSTIKHVARPREYGVLTQLSTFDGDMNPTTLFTMGQPMVVRIGVHIHRRISNAEVGFKICSRMGLTIHYFCSVWEGFRADLEPGDYVYEVRVPKILVHPGMYVIGAWLTRERHASDDHVVDICMFDVIGADVNGHSPEFTRYCVSGCEVYAPSEWKMEKVQ